LTCHKGRIRCITSVPRTDLVVTGSNDTTGKVWNAKSGEKLFDLTGHGDSIQCITSVAGTDLEAKGLTRKHKQGVER